MKRPKSKTKKSMPIVPYDSYKIINKFSLTSKKNKN